MTLADSTILRRGGEESFTNGVKTMLSDLKRIIDQISRDRGFDKSLLIEAIEEAVRAKLRGAGVLS